MSPPPGQEDRQTKEVYVDWPYEATDQPNGQPVTVSCETLEELLNLIRRAHGARLHWKAHTDDVAGWWFSVVDPNGQMNLFGETVP